MPVRKDTPKETIPAVVERENTALAHDPEARKIAERVLAIQAHTKWDMPVEKGKPLMGAALDAWLEKKEDQRAITNVERGIGYLLKKRELGHGAFLGWVEDRGASPRSVQEDMKVATMIVHLSAEASKRALSLPQRKLAALTAAPVPLIEDLFKSGALDTAAEMSRDELKELVNLRKKLEQGEQREDNLNDTIARQHEELRRVRALSATNQHLLELRRAVLEETEAVRANAHTLQAVMDQVALLPHDVPGHEIDAIVHPLMFALQGLQATCAALLTRGYERFDHQNADLTILPPMLSPDEVETARENYADFLNLADRRTAHRQADLGIAPKRGRGRPRIKEKAK